MIFRQFRVYLLFIQLHLSLIRIFPGAFIMAQLRLNFLLVSAALLINLFFLAGSHGADVVACRLDGDDVVDVKSRQVEEKGVYKYIYID